MFRINNPAGYGALLGEAFPEYPEAMQLMTNLLQEGVFNPFCPNGRVRHPDSVVLHFDYGQSRNKVLLVGFRNKRYVLKRYKRPKVFAGFVKRYIGSKARKAARNASVLLKSGFNTARPVIWWECRERGVITDSWLITEFLDYHLIAEFREPSLNKIQKQTLMKAISLYMLRLHAAGFLPSDFNIGNLFYSADEKFHNGGNDIAVNDIKDFYIIDINRMKQGRVPGFHEVMKSFDQLGILPEEYPYLLYPYADARGWSRDKCVKEIVKIRHRNSLRKRLLHFK